MGSPVVVGVDGWDSRPAVDFAADEALRRHLPLRLVHAFRPLESYSAGTLVGLDLGGLLAGARTVLDILAAQLQRRYSELAVSTAVRHGYPTGVLVEESHRAALVVIGAGSVSAQVVAHAEAPVVVVRVPAAVDCVVVGVDGSPGAATALGFAFEEADARGLPLIAVYAWAELPDGQEDAERMLAEATAGWADKYPDVAVERRAVHGPSPAPALLSQDRGAALFVVGPRGRSGLAGMLLGSVSDGLLGHAHCPVAVVHQRSQA